MSTVGALRKAAAKDLVTELTFRGGTDVVVAVDGTARPVRALLLRAVSTVGLAAAAWLFVMLLGAGSASADTGNPDEPGAGLLGGLLGTVSGVVTGQASTVAAPPVTSPPPAAPAVTAPEPASAVAPAVTQTATVRLKAAGKPTAARVGSASRPAVATKRKAKAEAASEPHPVVAPASKPEPVGSDEANRSGQHPEPTKAPPPAPAGSMASAHDGGGQARGGAGLLPSSSRLEPPAEAFTTAGPAPHASSRSTGLPVASPD